MTHGQATIKTRWLKSPSSGPRACSVDVSKSPTPGVYTLTTQPTLAGDYSLEVSINGEAMQQPITIQIIEEARGMRFDPARCHFDITLSPDRKTATRRGMERHDAGVLGLPGKKRGCHCWLIKIGPEPRWYCLGVSTSTLPGSSIRCQYGWSSIGQKVGEGHDHKRLSSWQGNDRIQMTLDCDRHTLGMINLRSGESHTITGLPEKELFPSAEMNYANRSVSFE